MLWMLLLSVFVMSAELVWWLRRRCVQSAASLLINQCNINLYNSYHQHRDNLRYPRFPLKLSYAPDQCLPGAIASSAELARVAMA